MPKKNKESKFFFYNLKYYSCTNKNSCVMLRYKIYKKNISFHLAYYIKKKAKGNILLFEFQAYLFRII